MSKVYSIIRQSDCLVLPSRFDGWGAVVTESLMIGTLQFVVMHVVLQLC